MVCGERHMSLGQALVNVTVLEMAPNSVVKNNIFLHVDAVDKIL